MEVKKNEEIYFYIFFKGLPLLIIKISLILKIKTHFFKT